MKDPGVEGLADIQGSNCAITGGSAVHSDCSLYSWMAAETIYIVTKYAYKSPATLLNLGFVCSCEVFSFFKFVLSGLKFAWTPFKRQCQVEVQLLT